MKETLAIRPAKGYNERIVMTVMPAATRRIAIRASLLIVLAATVALVTLPRFIGEAADPVYTLVASNWDGGGGRTTGSGGGVSYTLESSIGQPDAGLLPANATGLNAGFTLEGGFQHMQLPLDTNCDDHVTAVDALHTLRFIAGLDLQGACSGDANRDAFVNVGDALIIRQRVAGIVIP